MNLSIVKRKFWRLLLLLTIAAMCLVAFGGETTSLAREPQTVTADNFVFLPFMADVNLSARAIYGEDSPVGITGREPVAAVVNPRSPNIVAVANFCTLRISTNFGQTFQAPINCPLPNTLIGQGYGTNADDALAFDSRGNLYWVYLLPGDHDGDGTRDDLTVVVTTIDPMTGTVLSSVDITPGDLVDDKPWIAADANPDSPYADNVYVVWSRLGAPEQLMFSRSTNRGATFSAPATVSTEAITRFPHIAVGFNGDVYVTYRDDVCGPVTQNNVLFLRDGSGGANLQAGVPLTGVVKTTAFPAGQATVPCNYQDTADVIPNTDFLMAGALQAYVLPDPMRPGNIYIVANDDPNDAVGSEDDGEVVMVRSSDYGNNWSTKKTISHAPLNTLQVFPMGAIDQDGNIVVHWYDNRRGATNAAGNWLLDRYATVSRDGGLTFSNDFSYNDDPFDPDLGAGCFRGCGPGETPTTRIGEYHGIWAVNGIAYATWTANNAAGQHHILFDIFSMLGVFPDRHEPNESIDFSVVTSLGADDTYHEPSLTIHSPTDVDFFKVQAYHTGKLDIEIEFNEQVNDLDLRAFDKFGSMVPAASIATILRPGSSAEMKGLPVVAGEYYFIQVLDANNPNARAPQSLYDLTIINRPIPAPFGIRLAIGSDSGWDDGDSVTNVTNPTILVRVDDLWLEGLNFSPNNGTATLADDDPGYKVAIYRNGNLAGFALPVGGQPGDLFFTFPATEPLSEGINGITARVYIVDPADDPAVPGTAHIVGRGPESGVYYVTVDTMPPPPPSIPDLLDSSDSGASDSDNVTSVNPPAFGGTAEANAIIRIFANDELVGEGVVGSDATDGILGNGLGAWEVTIEPLADGTYAITANAEDRAGNISMFSGALEPPLVIDTPDGGGMPQRPTLDLLDAFDTGRSNNDNITYLTTLDFRISAEAGSTVVVKDGNTVIDTFVMPAEAFTIRTLVLAEGPHPMSTESTDLAGNTSHQSQELHVTVDTIAPDTPAAPDLLASSDSGGVSIDNITTIHTPTFEGFGEANAIVRIYADSTLVGQGLMTSWGIYQISVFPLDDGVYDMTATFEDEAGNVSEVSAALQVTIARISLTLPGDTTGPASGDVNVDLAAGTVTGYPGVPGGVIGVIGIPTVNLDANGFGLNVWGTAWDDNLGYSPSGAQSGAVINYANGQTFNFSNAAGDFVIDPLAGSDTVTVNGTTSTDTVWGDITTFSSVQVNDFKVVLLPTDHTETLGIASGQSVDIITLVIFDTVNGHLYVDGGDPSNVSHEQDELHVYDGVGNGRFKNLSGGPNPGEGSLEIEFPRTTGNTTRVDFVEIEKMRTYGQPPN